MKTITAALPLLGLAFVATPAAAQEATEVSPVTLRAELNFGYDEVRARYRSQPLGFIRRYGETGVTSGAEAGVDANFANLTVGGYAGINFSQVDGCASSEFGQADNFCYDAGRSLRAGLRGGVRLGDTGQIYVKGGLSRSKLRAAYTTAPTSAAPNGILRFTDSDTAKGYHLGAGAEIGLGGGAYAKGEYIYESYKSAFTVPTGDTIKPSRNQILFGVGYRFGGFGAF
jgi:opacity protein-like surface antigen